MVLEGELRRPLLTICAIGVALRFAFLALAGPVEFQADEANYLYLALSWNHFGFYSDSFRYLWPPGYPFVLAVALQLFGAGGPSAIKLLQVMASASIGATTMLVAHRLFGLRAARVAGLLWCVYLPLIGFTHYLWSETLFLALLLPALYLMLQAVLDPDETSDRRLIVAGLLFGAALYLKEVPLYLGPLLAVLPAAIGRREAVLEGVRRGTLFLLAVLVVVTPWTLRNYEVYGRFVPVGTSLGENVYHGLNDTYTNFDLLPFIKSRGAQATPEIVSRDWFVRADGTDHWQRAIEIPNTPDRLAENVRRGTAYATAHPGWLVRSRVKKLADLFAPVSFFVRHQGLGKYSGGILGAPGVRQLTALGAVLLSAAVMLLAIPGFFIALENRAARWFVGIVLCYFTATSLIVAMSRFRIPLVPWLIVLAAGFLAGPRNGDPRLGRVLAGVCAALLLFLWWVDLPEVGALLGAAWGGSS